MSPPGPSASDVAVQANVGLLANCGSVFACARKVDLFLRRILLACRPADVLDDLLGRILRQIGMLSHLRSCERYDEPETLPSSICLICPTSADGGQAIVGGDAPRLRNAGT